LAAMAREGLRSIAGVKVHDQGRQQGGIVTFTLDGLPPNRVRELLYERGTNIWTCTVRAARLDMQARDLQEVARASFHYYNTEAELETFLDQVRELSKEEMS